MIGHETKPIEIKSPIKYELITNGAENPHYTVNFGQCNKSFRVKHGLCESLNLAVMTFH